MRLQASKQASKQASNKNKLVRDRRGVGDKLEICQKYTVADKKQGDNPKKKKSTCFMILSLRMMLDNRA
jgi:hypothetical protein